MQDSMDQQEDDWLSMPDDSSTFNLDAFDHDYRSAAIITCPGCRTCIQPSYALNHASCSCGCSFCARCGTLYLSSLGPQQQPAAEAAQQQQQQLLQPGGSSISSCLLVASCSCGAVDKAAVAARWGAPAVACWPPEPWLQELLLQLLQQHQQQVVPLLSRQLLRRLQVDTQLHWETVQQAAGVMQQPILELQQQHQHQQKQAAVGSADNAQQRPSLELMPADATPSFVSNGHAAEQRDDTMQVDGEPHSAAAAAAAAALRITAASATAAAAAQGSRQQNGPVVVQQNGPAAQVQQGWQQQEQRLLDISMPAVAAEQLQEALEQHLLLDLAADVAAAGQQQEAAAAAEDACLACQLPRAQPAKLQAAAPSSSGVQGEDGSAQLHSGAPMTMRLPAQQPPAAAGVGAGLAREAGAAAQHEHHGQLGLEDLLVGQPQQQGPEPMQQDCNELDELAKQQLAAEQRQRQQQAGSDAADAVLAAKGGKLQLAAAAGWDEEDGSRPAAAAGAGSVPQLSALGLLPEAPPVLPDEPVALLLLPSQAQEEQPGHSRMFW